MSKQYKAKFYRRDFVDEADVIFPAQPLKSLLRKVLDDVGNWEDYYLVTIADFETGRVVRRVCCRSGHDRRKSDRR